MTVSNPFAQAVQDAHSILSDKIVCTPILQSKSIARIAQKFLGEKGFPVPAINMIFKCENLQTTGSFKFRGTTHFMSKMSESQLLAGVVAYSTG